MSSTQVIYGLVAVFWSLAILQGFALVRGGIRLFRVVRRSVTDSTSLCGADGRFIYQPRAAVILPCCGVDERLHQTVESLGRQNYDDYEVIFTFESADDAAHAAVAEWTATWQRPPARRVIAGLAEHRGQKVHNLLAAMASISPDREVLAFLDSDAIPHTDWLGHLVAPLRDPNVGAATGFRWYGAAGGVANGIRSCWNAASLTLITDEKRSFVWGGSMAVLRGTFERLGVARSWERALSDDYQMTRAVHQGGLKISFVPQALIPSHESTDFRSFWSFARRQIVITRVCGPAIWRFALLLCLNFFIGGSAVAVLFFAVLFGWIGDTTVMWTALAGWLAIIGISCVNAGLRQLAIRQILRRPDVTWQDFAWDVGGVNLSGMLHLALMVASLSSNRFVWRNTEYEIVSADETRILRRLNRDRSAWCEGQARPTPAPGTLPSR